MSDWKKLFELKQEDWFALCKEVDAQAEEIARLRAQLAASEASRIQLRGALEKIQQEGPAYGLTYIPDIAEKALAADQEKK